MDAGRKSNEINHEKLDKLRRGRGPIPEHILDEFVAGRIGQCPDELAPRTLGYVALGVAIAAYEQWLETDDADLSDLMDSAMRQLAAAFGGGLAAADPGAAGARAALSA